MLFLVSRKNKERNRETRSRTGKYFKWIITQLLNLAFVGYEKFCRSRRVLSSASVDNILLDLQISSYPTQPHSIIAKYYYQVLVKVVKMFSWLSCSEFKMQSIVLINTLDLGLGFLVWTAIPVIFSCWHCYRLEHLQISLQTKTAVYLFLERFFISFWSDVFTFINRKMYTFDLIIVKGDTLRLLV